MTAVVFQFACLIMLFTLVGAFLPNAAFRVLCVAFGAVTVAYLAPLALLWMIAITGLAWATLLPDINKGRETLAVVVVCVVAVGALLILREADWITSLGAAYFTLRVIHVSVDVWSGAYEPPKLRNLIVYMMFPPTFLLGPIHRYPHFMRELDRRRVSRDRVVIGAERMLTGLFMTVFLGGYVSQKLNKVVTSAYQPESPFLADWVQSAFGWIDLYFVFAGLSSFVIGACFILGLRIEENFNHPYRARSLVAFWSRWHMSLTSWCRDYVFRPITAITRKPAIGVLFAMLVLGLWHETTVFYVCWSIWQALGIIVSRLVQPVFDKLPDWLDIALSPFLLLGWLSLANPIASRIEGLII